MNKKFRFKTKEEFQNEGRWIENSGVADGGFPLGWNNQGAMNSYLGQAIPEESYAACQDGKNFYIGSWCFNGRSYVVDSVVTQASTVSGLSNSDHKLKPDFSYFDIERVANELNGIMQQLLDEGLIKHYEMTETCLKNTDVKLKEYKTNVDKIFGDIKENLIAEITKGRTVVVLPNAQSVAIQETDHPKLMDVVKSLNIHHKAMLVGPAGTGKTYMIAELAKRMDLPFYKYSCSRDSSVHDLLGYKQPRSETYLETAFLKAYENGGIFLVDEYDAMSGDMALFFNGVADSSKFIAVPHRDEKPIAQKHKDFYLVMCGNTWGKGSVDYSGRDFQDMALMDRFRFCRHFINYHTSLEKIFMGDNYGFTVELRKRLEKVGSYLSTRNIEDISLLLQTGVSKNDIVEMVSQDLEEDERRTIKSLVNG